MIASIRTHPKPGYKSQERDTPRKFLSPLCDNSRVVCTTLFPLDLPNLVAVERGTAVEARASKRIKFRFGEMQRHPELTGRREHIEIRCMDKCLVATREDRALVRGREGKEKMTS